MRCLCEACSPDAPGRTWTRAFITECEIRDVMALPSNEDRKRYLEKVEKHRGANAAHRLREAVWKEMRAIA